jgi:hypothetical protein
MAGRHGGGVSGRHELGQRALAVEDLWGPDQAYPSIISDISFAFFESPTIFLIRIGDLGSNPIYLRLQLENWQWRVTGIHEC